jgi:hypothetical protein
MNLITFNEHFAVVATAEGRADYEKACVAPLFEYTAVHDHVYDNIQSLAKSDPDGEYSDFKLPFPILRMEIILRNKSSEIPVGIRYQLMAFTSSGRIYFRVLDTKHRVGKNVLFYFEFGRKSGDFDIALWSDRDKRWNIKIRANVKDSQLDDAYFEIYRQLVGSVVAFSVDSMSPNIHMATVAPDEPGRSVQWRKARTHYTLISHGHPANKATVGHGARIANDTSAELVRMAHNRRAHYKTLKHERYKFARGKRIFVKATWVGPKEWRDEGGKQIYRILEPSNWQPGDPIT